MLKHLQVVKKQQQVYHSKLQEYSNMTLDELKALFNGPKRIGGTYRVALLEIVNKKLEEQKDEAVKHGIEQLKKEETDI